MIAWSSTTRTDRVISCPTLFFHVQQWLVACKSCGPARPARHKFLNERLAVLWLPAQEVADQLEPGRLALLRMELRSGEIVAPDHGRDRSAILGGGEQGLGFAGLELEGVHEIGVIVRLQALQEGMRFELQQLVPAHVRD